MAKEIRDIIRFQEQQVQGGRDRLKEVRLGALHIIDLAIDHAERLGALPSSLPQFSRAAGLTQPGVEQPAAITPLERIQADLGLTPEQVASDPSQITEGTRAYVGSFVHQDGQGRIIPIFEALKSVDQIYTAEGREIPRWSLKVGGKSVSELGMLLDEAKTRQPKTIVSKYAESMFRNPDFAESLVSEEVQIDLVMPNVQDLGFPRGATTAEIIGRENDTDKHGSPASFTKGRMTALGLYPCPREVGVFQRRADVNQEMNTWYWIAMKPIADSAGHPGVFELVRSGSCLWLGDRWADPGSRWRPGGRLAFSFRK